MLKPIAEEQKGKREICGIIARNTGDDFTLFFLDTRRQRRQNKIRKHHLAKPIAFFTKFNLPSPAAALS